MNKLLIVCGPTATGKTSLGLRLAKKFDGEIVSADSRQVYQLMDIGTGKDLPSKAKFIKKDKSGYYLIEGVKLWGYDLVHPRKDFSVGQYLRVAKGVIEDIWKRGKLPVLVGGTGLYIKGVVGEIDTALIPRNRRLRKSLEKKSREALFDQLAVLDSTKAASLNASDKKNPRRLVRAIEIALYRQPRRKMGFLEADCLYVGLATDKETIRKRIEKRVKERIDQNFGEEIDKLLKMGVKRTSQAMQALGYQEWALLAEGKITEERAVERWMRKETKYAKRQLLWFNRVKQINWFDIGEKEYREHVDKLVEKWYNKTDA